MTTVHQPTPEEEAYRWLFADNKEMLSEAVRTILAAAEVEAFSVSDVRGEILRVQSGSALALKTYLKKLTEERLKWLTCAVLVARKMNTTDWKRHASVVKEAAENRRSHPLDCECEECA